MRVCWEDELPGVQRRESTPEEPCRPQPRPRARASGPAADQQPGEQPAQPPAEAGGLAGKGPTQAPAQEQAGDVGLRQDQPPLRKPKQEPPERRPQCNDYEGEVEFMFERPANIATGRGPPGAAGRPVFAPQTPESPQSTHGRRPEGHGPDDHEHGNGAAAAGAAGSKPGPRVQYQKQGGAGAADVGAGGSGYHHGQGQHWGQEYQGGHAAAGGSQPAAGAPVAGTKRKAEQVDLDADVQEMREEAGAGYPRPSKRQHGSHDGGDAGAGLHGGWGQYAGARAGAGAGGAAGNCKARDVAGATSAYRPQPGDGQYAAAAAAGRAGHEAAFVQHPDGWAQGPAVGEKGHVEAEGEELAGGVFKARMDGARGAPQRGANLGDVGGPAAAAADGSPSEEVLRREVRKLRAELQEAKAAHQSERLRAERWMASYKAVKQKMDTMEGEVASLRKEVADGRLREQVVNDRLKAYIQRGAQQQQQQQQTPQQQQQQEKRQQWQQQWMGGEWEGPPPRGPRPGPPPFMQPPHMPHMPQPPPGFQQTSFQYRQHFEERVSSNMPKPNPGAAPHAGPQPQAQGAAPGANGGIPRPQPQPQQQQQQQQPAAAGPGGAANGPSAAATAAAAALAFATAVPPALDESMSVRALKQFLTEGEAGNELWELSAWAGVASLPGTNCRTAPLMPHAPTMTLASTRCTHACTACPLALPLPRTTRIAHAILDINSCAAAAVAAWCPAAGAEATVRLCSEKGELLKLARERLNGWEIRRAVACSRLADRTAGDCALFRVAAAAAATRAALVKGYKDLLLRLVGAGAGSRGLVERKTGRGAPDGELSRRPARYRTGNQY